MNGKTKQKRADVTSKHVFARDESSRCCLSVLLGVYASVCVMYFGCNVISNDNTNYHSTRESFPVKLLNSKSLLHNLEMGNIQQCDIVAIVSHLQRGFFFFLFLFRILKRIVHFYDFRKQLPEARFSLFLWLLPSKKIKKKK